MASKVDAVFYTEDNAIPMELTHIPEIGSDIYFEKYPEYWYRVKSVRWIYPKFGNSIVEINCEKSDRWAQE